MCLLSTTFDMDDTQTSEQLPVSVEPISDLDYADDIVLLETSRDRMQQLTETVETEGKKIGLQMNVKKCKTLVSDSWENSRDKN